MGRDGADASPASLASGHGARHIPPDVPDSHWERFVDRWVSAVVPHPGRWVLGAVALAALALVPARRLDLDARLEALLPKDAAAVRALDELSDRAVSSAPLYLLVQGSEPGEAWRVSEVLAEKVGAWPDVRRAINRRDPTYFEDRRLLFVPANTLEDFADSIDARVQWERCERIPGCVNLVDEPPPPDPGVLQREVAALPEVQAIEGVLGEDAVDRLFSEDAAGSEEGPDGASDENGGDGGDGFPLGALCSASDRVCVVEAILDGSPRDLDYAQDVLRRADAAFGEVRRETGVGDEVEMVVSGSFRNATVTREVVEEDLRNATSLSFGLVLLVLLSQFRGARAIALLLVPLVVGAAWAVGVIGSWHPRLNVISAFTLAILAGLGVDFGVHLLTHYGGQRDGGAAPAEALRETLKSLGASMIIAATTTGCAFAALAAASFRGFSEMGMLAAVGILLALLAFLLVFPPLVLLLHRWFPERRTPVRRWPFLRRIVRPPPGLAAPIVAGGVVLAGLSVWVGTGLSFEYDLKKLSPSVATGISYRDAMHGTKRTAVYLLADDPETLRQTAEAIRNEEKPLPGQADDRPPILTPEVFVPRDQPDRLDAIDYLREIVDDAERHAQGASAEAIETWRPYLGVTEPITPDALPGWAADFFRERDGTFGTLGILYVRAGGSDARAMERLARRMAQWRDRYPGVRFASPPALIGEIIPELQREAPIIAGLALAGLFIATVAFGRSVGRTVRVLAPTLVGIAFGLGGMVALGIKLNFYNMLILPLALGIGVDGAIYRVWAEQDARRSGSDLPLVASTRAILGSTLTTIVAFGALTVARNPGLASIGHLAMVALLVTLLSNLVWLPALLALARRLAPDGDR